MEFSRDVYVFMDGLPSGVVVFSPAGAPLYANPQARRLLGATGEVAGPLDAFIKEDGTVLGAEEHPVATVLRTGNASRWQMLAVLASKSSERVWMRVQAAPVTDGAGRLEYVVVSLEDATQLMGGEKHASAREWRAAGAFSAETGMTGDCGRRQGHALLARAVVEARERDIPLSACLLDLDRFKRLNQAFGRACGDEVLLHVAEHLGACLHEGETFTRLGGGEFLVLLPGVTLRDAWQEMEEFRECLAASPVACTGRCASVSGGLVALRADEDAPALLNRADSLLYLAKLDGRNRIVPDASIPASLLA